jgi:hypothetical protein
LIFFGIGIVSSIVKLSPGFNTLHNMESFVGDVDSPMVVVAVPGGTYNPTFLGTATTLVIIVVPMADKAPGTSDLLVSVREMTTQWEHFLGTKLIWKPRGATGTSGGLLCGCGCV